MNELTRKLGFKWFNGSIRPQANTNTSFNAAIRVGYTDSDHSSILEVSDGGVFNANGLVRAQVETYESHDAIIYVYGTGRSHTASLVKVVNGAIMNIDGSVYVMFSGDEDIAIALGIPDETSSNIPATIIITESGNVYTATIFNASAGVQATTYDDMDADIGVGDIDKLDTYITIGAAEPAWRDTLLVVKVSQPYATNYPMFMKVVTGIVSDTFDCRLRVIPGLKLSHAVPCLMGVKRNMRNDYLMSMIIDPLHGRQFDAGLGIRQRLQKSFGCSLFITEFGTKGRPPFVSLGESGGDITSPAGIPPRTAYSRGKLPIFLRKYGLSMLPSWMDMVKYSKSTGNIFFNAIGTEIGRLQDEVIGVINNQFIQTARPKLDVIGKIDLPAGGITSVIVPMIEADDGTRYRWKLIEATSSHKFYHSDIYYGVNLFEVPDGTPLSQETLQMTGRGTLDTYYIDKVDGVVYFRFSNGRYTSAIVNGASISVAPHQLWNELDDIGALISLDRMEFESNNSYRARILDVFDQLTYQYKETRDGVKHTVTRFRAPNSTFIGLSLAIARELGIASMEADGDFRVKINSLSDRNYQLIELLDENLVPNEKFESLVEEINRQIPVAWNDIAWDEGRWFTKKQTQGWPTLKNVWDILQYSGELE